jgi:hypothetical protein
MKISAAPKEKASFMQLKTVRDKIYVRSEEMYK